MSKRIFLVAAIIIPLLLLTTYYNGAFAQQKKSVGGEQEAASSTTTNNNVSNAALGSLFLTGEDKLTSFMPINKTYTKVSYAGNRTIIPPDSTATATINATESGNLTFNLQPNGIALVEGQSLLVTKGGKNTNGSEQENATALLVDLNGVRANDPRSSTGVAFFRTNSTGQLAFLHNMIAIYQVKASPVGTAITMWEWKGADLPQPSNTTHALVKQQQQRSEFLPLPTPPP